MFGKTWIKFQKVLNGSSYVWKISKVNHIIHISQHSLHATFKKICYYKMHIYQTKLDTYSLHELLAYITFCPLKKSKHALDYTELMSTWSQISSLSLRRDDSKLGIGGNGKTFWESGRDWEQFTSDQLQILCIPTQNHSQKFKVRDNR